MNQQERLWKAAENGDSAEIRRAIISGADPEATDEKGRTALNIASQHSHPDAMRTLLAARHIADLTKIQIEAQAKASEKPKTPSLLAAANLPDGPVDLELEQEEDSAPVFEEEPRKWWFLGRGRRSA